MKIELLAPAGSYEGMAGAIGAGADAVYAGGTLFGARAYAKNFETEELLSAIDYVHIHGKKLYLTVNTLMKNQEMEGQLYTYLAPFYEQGLDAVIVQDLGVLSFIRKQFPDLPVHASTQMTVTGAAGMRFLEEKGVTRVVTARELSLEEIRVMHQASPLEIEVFVHGALCYCYSGQCLFSSLLGGRSGNRGRCAQPCRLPYQYGNDGKRFTKGEELHPLSPKDMCAISLLPSIIEAGVTSLKIEGRMKQPGYTAGVVEIYRKYLDLYEKDPAHFAVEEADRRYLLELFSRGGSHEGYFSQHNGPSMMAFHTEKKIGGAYPEIRTRKERIQGTMRLFPGHPAILEVVCGEIHLQLEKGEVQAAKSQPMTEERIRQQMEKTGDAPYEWEQLTIQLGGEIFLPVKVLNELRREAFAALTEAKIEAYKRKRREPFFQEKMLPRGKEAQSLFFTASCETKEQVDVCLQTPEIARVYLPLSLIEVYGPKVKAAGKEVFLMLPHVTRLGDEVRYEKGIARTKAELDGYLVRNLEAFSWLREKGEAAKCLLDASVYTWNTQSQAFWEEAGVLGDSIPLELNAKELRHRDNARSELLLYGRLPLMVSAQCVQKNLEACRKDHGVVYLRDRMQKVFPVKCECDPCYNVIYNSLPYGLLKEAEQVKAMQAASLRFSFTLETEGETRKILGAFLAAYSCQGKTEGQADGLPEFTKGHWKRGVE